MAGSIMKRPKAKRGVIETCLAILVHYGKCRKKNGTARCESAQCKKIGRLDNHLDLCKHKQTCTVCKQVILMLKLHSTRCIDNDCTIRNCATNKGNWL